RDHQLLSRPSDERISRGLQQQNQSPQEALLWDHKHFASVSTYLARSRRFQVLRDLRSQDIVDVPAIPKEPKKIVASARLATWLLLRDAEKLEAEERTFVEHLVEMSPEIAEAQILAREFNRILKQRDREALPSWMERMSQSRIREMKSLAAGLERDRAAVAAALEYEWSSGPTEGHINRLKTLKRAMYGRAKFDLLRIRVLAGSKRGTGRDCDQ